jgi:hypothetical protein
VPFIADLKPSGKYVMEDVHKVGGTPGLLKYLHAQGLIEGSCMTVTGYTMAENLASCPDLSSGQDVILPLDSPIKPSGHIQILYGNLAPEGSVAKITGKEGLKFTGQVRRRGGRWVGVGGWGWGGTGLCWGVQGGKGRGLKFRGQVQAADGGTGACVWHTGLCCWVWKERGWATNC